MGPTGQLLANFGSWHSFLALSSEKARAREELQNRRQPFGIMSQGIQHKHGQMPANMIVLSLDWLR